ncbi:MAG: YdgA family protein [Sulfurimonas sp.]|nr:YdgA family protein [Sulfurimonas sp.]
MKKSLIITAIAILSIIIALPFFGNSIIELSIKDRIKVLNSYGLEIKNIKTDSTYFKSKKYYSIYVKDANKFIAYLNQFSNSQIPPYVDTMIDGTKLEVKVQYSNIPLTDSVSIDVYPLKLSENITNMIKDNDIEFSEYFSDFLSNKGFVYHLKYNLLSKKFNGHIKDIDENYTLASGHKVDFKLSGTTFNGEGILIAPQKFNSKVDEVSFKIEKGSEKLDILFSNMSSSLVFKSKTDYTANYKINSIAINAVDKDSNKSKIIFDNLDLDFSINTKDDKLESFTKLTWDKLLVNTPKVITDLDSFKYEVSLTKIDKDSFESIMDLINQVKVNQTQQTQKQINDNIILLLSKGLELKIADLSVDKVTINKTEDLENFSLKADFILPPNTVLVNKQINPINIINEMKIDILIKISKKMFTYLDKTQPFLGIAKDFAKEQNQDFVFDIKIYDGNITVNDRAIQ